LPLSALNGLIKAAAKREKEHTLFPLWLAGYAVARIKNEKFIDFEDFIGDKAPKAKSADMTAEEIEKEFAPIIAADEAKRAV